MLRNLFDNCSRNYAIDRDDGFSSFDNLVVKFDGERVHVCVTLYLWPC